MGAPWTGGPWGRGQPRASRAGAPPKVRDLKKEAGPSPPLFLLSITAGGSTTTAQAANKQGTVCARRGQTFPVSCLTVWEAAQAV